MNRKILFIIFIFSPISAFTQGVMKDSLYKQATVYLVGTAHNMHFDSERHYSVNDLLEHICTLKPDLVCGEITPQAFNKPMEGYFPPEAAFLAEMSVQCNYRFAPVDWRLDIATQSIAYSEYPTQIKEKRSALLKELFTRLDSLNHTSLYDFMHHNSTLNDLDSLYEKIIGTNVLAEIASGSWRERNRCIIERGLAVADGAQVIVFVFGLDHLPGLKRHLKLLGIDAKIPKRNFVPSKSMKVSQSVLKRWKRNHDNLVLIKDKKIPASLDNYQKVIKSRRIEYLEEAIHKSK